MGKCYKVPRGPYRRPSIITPDKLQREFTVEQRDRAWERGSGIFGQVNMG